MANSALKEPAGYHAKAKEEMPAPIRVVLPSSAQAAEVKPVVQQTEHPVTPTPQIQTPVKEAQATPEKAEKTDKKADADKRRHRAAERKAQRLAARRNHRPEGGATNQAPVLAFGSDEPRTGGGNFSLFGN
ncbi:type IV secretory pathway VirB10-like protein [Bradyrhizobium sp. USDA 4472]